MATGKVVGQIQVTQGNIKVVGVDGTVREPGYEGYMYENEQVVSNDPNALFQIKFLALPEASAYDGIFRILADGSVIHGRDAMDSMMSDENLVKVLETAAADEGVEDLETAAGEEGAEGSSSFTETDIVAESSVLGFSRGANGELGYGIVDFGSLLNYDAAQITPPAITSPNVVIYDENGTEPVIQVSATASSDITYSIGGLDSGFFDIDSVTGLVTFKESPDFENPRDSGGDNEYNTYVTATDSYGNYTTQLLSVSINNLNEAVTAFDDTVDAVEDTILSSTIDLDANDTDLDGDALSVTAGTYTTAQGGTIVIAADGSYTYTPPTNFNGTDSVNYTVTDGEFSDVGTLTINVAPANDAPVAVDDAVNAVEDTVLNSAIDLDANDYDIDGDALSVIAGTFATANGGQLVLASDGTYTYTPAANFNGIDSVDYTVTDGELTDVGTLTINVAAVDDTPPPPPPPPPPPVDGETVVIDDEVETDEDTSVTIDVLANDTDEDSPISPVASVTNGSNGTVAINEDGTLTYTPEPNFSGSDSFTYTNTENNTATVNVTVNATADVPMLSMEITETEDTKSEWVVDEDANAAAGIYLGDDGITYYQDTAVVISDEYGMNSKLNQGHFITFEQSTQLADYIELNVRFTGNSSAVVQFFEGENFVDELPLLGEKNVDTLNTYTPSGSFDNIVFLVVYGEKTSAIFLKSYSFEYLVPTVVDPIMEELVTTVYEYTITTDAELTDETEELSNIEIDLGEALEGVDLIDNDDGTYTFESETQLGTDVLDAITATVTSTEENGDEASITVNQNGIVSIEGGSGSDAMEYDEYDTFDTEIDGGDGFDTVIGDSEEIDLSNVSNIEVIQLNSGATVIGTGDGNSINPADVLSATDGGTLIIQSDDGDASTQAYADSTFGDATTVVIDGNSYAQYVDGDATLLIQIEDIVVPT